MTFRSSRISRDRREDAFARAVVGEAERRRRAGEQRLRTPCEYCGQVEFADLQEREWHERAECVGGDERFQHD
jgi:hypothetical protein